MLQFNKKFVAGIDVANRFQVDRFSLFLERIITKLSKKEKPFSMAEEERLMQIVGLSAEEFHLLVDACNFVFEKAAAESMTATLIKDLLKPAGLSAALLAVFEGVWKVKGQALVDAFKEKPFETPADVLVDVQWRVHLQVAGGESNHNLDPLGILQLRLLSSNQCS
eukprot:c21886_g1_i3 orf=251-748(+)